MKPDSGDKPRKIAAKLTERGPMPSSILTSSDKPDSGEREVPLSLQQVHLPIRLAQRILAALVQRREWELASELRAAVERKP